MAQAPAKVDFAADVLPIFRQNCMGCHGPALQQGGLRLDRKSSVVKPFSRRVRPGSSANSFVYHRVSGTEYGPQMPPTGALRPEQIATIKNWIDQGAEWPDSLANEKDLPPTNPLAVAMVESLRDGDLASVLKAASADSSLLNARGPEGSTPFMYAVLYSNTATLARLLKLGADPNRHNDANATALMWAARDLEKTRLLLDHDAQVNARSDNFRTPLLIAARRAGAAPIVKLMLDRGANPNPNAKPEMESSPLIEALTSGDATIVELLLRHGADAKATEDMGLTMAVTTKYATCLDLLAAQITDTGHYTLALQNIAHIGDVKSVRLLLDHGADVNAFDPLGRTPLMYAAISDALPLDVVNLLIERGADVNAKDRHAKGGDSGWSVLDIARQNGDTPIVQALLKAGAKGATVAPVALQPRHGNTIRNVVQASRNVVQASRNAVQASLPPLQRADAKFTANAGCISCHNDSLAAMAVGLARKRGFRIDEQTASAQVRTNVQFLEKSRDILHQGFFVPVGDIFGENVLAYMLVGLYAENYKADLNTDAAALLLLSRQHPDGSWPYPAADTRPPICLDYIGQTALAMRALQLYAPMTDKAASEKSIQSAASWLANAKSSNNDDRGWRLAGLAWAGTDKTATQRARLELLAAQRPDGGWSDLPSMQSTAYATGKSLVALQIGGVPVSDAAYQRGVQFLLSTQQEDGSWFVRTRALAFQPYFDAGFPHAYDQWVSAAGTSWATMALTLALPETGPVTASRLP